MPIRVDQRLAMIASLVEGDVIADIGCDHGKLGYYLIGTERVKRVIATDISAQSLRKAEELAKENGVSQLMQTRLGDGLAPIADGEADTVVIAGLGGDVISNIITRAHEDGKRFKHFVLSPNTHPEKVRRAIVDIGHTIVYDDVVECAGKRYTLIKTQCGDSLLDELQEMFGAYYFKNDGFANCARQELEQKQQLYAQTSSAQLAKRIELLTRALANYNACRKTEL